METRRARQRGGVRSRSLLKSKSKTRTKTRAAFTGYAGTLFQYMLKTRMDWRTSGVSLTEYITLTANFLKASVVAYQKSIKKASIRTEMELMFVELLGTVSPTLEELLAKRSNLNSQDEGFFDVEAVRVLEDYRTIIYGDITAAVARVKSLYKFLDEYVSLLADYRGDADFEAEADLFSLTVLNAVVPVVQEHGQKLIPMLTKKRSTAAVLRTARKPAARAALPTIVENETIDELANLLSKSKLGPK